MSYYVHTPLIALFINLLLIFLVLRKNHRSLLHQTFSLFLLGMGLWALCIFGMRSSPDLESALIWDRAVIAIGPWMGVFFFHFTLLFSRAKPRTWLVPSAYLLCIFFSALAPTGLLFKGMQMGPYGYAPILGVLGYPALFAVYFFVILGLANLARFYRTNPDERNRTALIFAGGAFALLGSASDIAHSLQLPVPPLGIVSNILFGCLATAAILKYRLLDIHVVIRKGLAYTLLSGLVVGIYVLMVFLISGVLQWQKIGLALVVVMTLVIAIALQPILRWVQRAVDRWFYHDRYDYLKALGAFSQETQSVTDSAKLGSTMVNLLTGALRISSVYILQPLPSDGDFIIAFPSDSYRSTSHVILKRRSPLVKWLERSKKMLSYDDIDIIPQLQGITSKEKESLQQLHTKFITGLKTPMGQLSGLLILGPKLSDQPYTIEDKELIHTICNQMSTNLENARLYAASQQEVSERKRVEEELKQSHEQLRKLSAHVESMREAERTSIAREVHDELGQALTAIKMDLSWLNKRLPEKQEALIKKAREMSRLIGTTIQTVKRISTELRPGVLDDLGLMAAIEWQAQEFHERTRIKCELTAEGEDINLDRDLATAVFRILQEALTNVARHANATRVEVSLKKGDGQLVLQVRDNGKGITEKQIAHPESLGLIGMRERVRSWNGSVKIDGISGKGTIVTVSIPLNRKGEHDDKNTSR